MDMDDIDAYTGHADTVLSGLRNAVDTADERILQLQRELELLEKKAEYDDTDFLEKRLSESSGLTDDDLKDIPGISDDEKSIATLSSSTPIDVAMASTKMYDDSVNGKQSQKGKGHHVDTHQSECRNSSADEKEVNERWGCLKRVLSDECSSTGDSEARNDIFKQILRATEKKPIISKRDSKKKSKPAKPRVAYNGLFSTRGASSSNSTDETKSKPSPCNSGHKRENQSTEEPLYEASSAHTSARRDVCKEDGHALQELTVENQRLQKMLSDEKKHSSNLCDKICDLEKDVEELQIRIELKDHEDSTGKIAELVDEIQKAQKLRESTMLERINIASRDRDDAIMRARAMFLKKNSSAKGVLPDKDKNDQTMMDLVDKIADADSAAVVELYGNELLERVSNLKNARSRITEEEMAVVIRERDDAVAKCQNLEQELVKCMERLHEAKRSQKLSINAHLKEKVISTEKDCKNAHLRLRDAEEEIDNLKLSYRVFKSQANLQDEQLAKRYNGCLRNIQAEADLNSNLAKKMEIKNRQLVDRLHKNKVHLQDMRQENARLKDSYDACQEKCGKLERLVRVLRKKLISQAQHSMVSHE